MALPLGKLTIIVGAGVVGSVLAKEGRISDVSDFFSGALKVVLRQLRHDESTTSKPKPQNDSLMQQVNSLREELQLLASNRSITIVTSSGGSASGRYGVIVIVIVVGYGCIWWKGWKLSDMMFATRRSLSDACSSVSKQLESVYSAISATKRHLSSRIDGVDSKIDECAGNTSATKEEVSKLRGDLRLMGADVQSVHHVVRSLETKISKIEGKQGETLFGVGRLVSFVKNLEHSRTLDPIEAGEASLYIIKACPFCSGTLPSSSRPALEKQQITPSRAVSLPSNCSVESPSSSSSNGPSKRPLQGGVLDSGLKLHGMSNGVEMSSKRSSQISNDVPVSEVANESSGSGIFGLKSSGGAFNMVRRSCSAKLSFNI
ncbi:unnamed protein product [Coffea canephora]|uniref:DUF1664 domain-containing protein n=1 Tax=Coffea canephora TaxID=49390 RepID=A0A068UXU9_COFCA|nr:unnamed protein product [Coffea canephora]